MTTLFIFQSAVVFKVLNDPERPQTDRSARYMSDTLEFLSVIFMFGNVGLGALIEVRVRKLWSSERSQIVV